jgi:hypothetical protein
MMKNINTDGKANVVTGNQSLSSQLDGDYRVAIWYCIRKF